MSNDKLQEALESFPLGISIATVGRGGVENALTVSWASPVAFTPFHIAISIDRLHYSVDLLKSTKNFVLNVLREGQESLAGHFARQSTTDADKLDNVPTREASSGAAILTESLAYFDCEVVNAVDTGDHILFIGKVVDADVLNEGTPLTTTGCGILYRKSRPPKS